MNVSFRKIKSIVYLCVWILLVVVGWFLWFFGRYYFDPQSFLFPLTYGLGIGIVSGLPPTRAFLACFFGFSILAFLIGLYFSVFEGFVIFGILCGLFAMAGAIIRRILFRQRIEELYLKPWQWVLLICGVTILADRFVILGTFHELFVYHRIFSFFQFFVPSLVGLFALGLYTGAFYQLKYDELIKSVKMLSLGTHGAFLIYMIYRFVMRSISWEPFLTAILISLFFYIVLKGTQIGYKSRSKDFLNQANLEL